MASSDNLPSRNSEQTLPLWVALMVLTTVEEEQAPEEARYLLARKDSFATFVLSH